ncbi:hypothetical protein ABT144_28110 [Streptomyces sp. NPDC002039]|uniref:hypothetical protein n=1 Tax=Streptomyces sp. NPDC002039 TaxID=3154660 RepID=UPI00331D6887
MSVEHDPGGTHHCHLDEGYWDLVLAPHRPRMPAVLRGDVLHRAGRLTDDEGRPETTHAPVPGPGAARGAKGAV